ncbi:hypothetical protein V1514DRAFT_326201 [Lipomyces japonicus]|uniref:uncharacterized protein n=1 Tax=Lipomyces japonicus TaxID=56871 RepID=UPI0034CF518E
MPSLVYNREFQITTVAVASKDIRPAVLTGRAGRMPSSPLSRPSSDHDGKDDDDDLCPSPPLLFSRPFVNKSSSNHSNRRRRSSLHQAESLIGSYEESLLSGRMSAPSSKPAVSFLAKLGVLATQDTDGDNKDDCGPKCPPRHLLLEFEALYYEWHDTDNRQEGSPYVGVLDLDEHYANQHLHPLPRQRKRRRPVPGYKIPARGQIQIVISNPHRTAIKLFLVPYDLRHMTRGTRTFVRQKTAVVSDDRANKLGLKQAVHLHVACHDNGELYLFRTIRVVFENRTADSADMVPGLMPGLLDGTVRTDTIIGDIVPYVAAIKQPHQPSPSSSSSSSALLFANTAAETDASDAMGMLSLSDHCASKLRAPAHQRDDNDKDIVVLKTKNSMRQSNDDVQLITWGELYNRRLNTQ